jgi:hypothetical protein
MSGEVAALEAEVKEYKLQAGSFGCISATIY